VATYLLTWNPDRWSWPEDDIEGAIAALDGGRSFRMDWSTGNTKSTQPGDRFYLMRLGPEPRGIFASGIIVSENRETSHWDEAKAREGKTSRMASLDFIELIMTPLGQEKLRQAAPGVEWSPQSSGIKIPPESVLEIEKLWQTHLHEQGVPLRLVNDVEQARLSLRLFWQQMQAGHEVVKERAERVHKFVYDPEQDGFSPQWWCGYRGLSVETFEVLMDLNKGLGKDFARPFSRASALNKIEKLLKTESVPDGELCAKLAASFASAFDPDPFANRDKEKISFLRFSRRSDASGDGLQGVSDGIETTMSTELPLNRILYGPPGTGKTYRTRELSLEICGVDATDAATAQEEYKKLIEAGRIRFVTFHQSFSYEDFVEGIRPELGDGGSQLTYAPHDGVFKEICNRAASRAAGDQVYEFDEKNIQFWKMSLGNTQNAEDAPIYQSCIEEGRIKLGYGGPIDFSGCENLDDVRTSLRDKYPTETDWAAVSVNTLKNKMRVGDIVIVSDGKYKFRAIGRVSGEYQHSGEDDYSQVRPVQWLRTFEPSQSREALFEKQLSQRTLYEIQRKDLKVDILRDLLRVGPSGEAGPCVLILDEINRANISKVLGELITLLEKDKRLAGENEKRVTLPYSRELFGVPPNLYILGTMNTADRSIAFLDVALRRRFEFIEVAPDYEILRQRVGEVSGVDIADLLHVLNKRVAYLFDADHSIGHSYFLDIESLEDLKKIFLTKVIPLLQEYFYGDWEKLSLILGCKADPDSGQSANASPIISARRETAAAVFGAGDVDLDDCLQFEINPDFRCASGENLRAFFELAFKQNVAPPA
jgi:5-methylcytosine-specific restriction protein B